MATLNFTPLRTSSSPFFLSTRSSHVIPSSASHLHLKNSTFPSLSTFLKSSKKLNPRTALTIASAYKKLSEAELIELPNDLEKIVQMFPEEAGVYAVHDKNNDVQFIGITRNIAASAITHRKSQPELCWSIKAGIVDDPDRTTLTEAWKSWMEEHISISGKVPPGNESGNATWVQQQQKRKKADLRLTPGPNVQLTVPLEQLIDRLVKENKVVAFIKGSRSSPMCGFSQKVVGILESSGIDYESVDVLDEQYNRGLRETLKTYSNWPTFPQIFVNGELVGGCDILSSMHEKGELASLFGK